MRRLEEFKQREADFRRYTNDFIRREDEHFRELEQKEIVKRNKPLRHPAGRTYDRHSREYFWRDFLYCQDRHPEPFEMFFEVEQDEMQEMSECQGCEVGPPGDKTTEYGRVWEWFTGIFNDEFEKVCPDIKHVLEG